MPGAQSTTLKFADRVEYSFQQRMSVVEAHAQVQRVSGGGTAVAFNTLHPAGVPENITTTGGGHTKWKDMDQFNRWAFLQIFNEAVKLSIYDTMVMIADMTRPYINNAVFAHMRNIDDVFIEAAFGSAAQGTTPNEVAASTFNTAAPTNDGGGGNLIATNGAGAATGMSSAKLKLAMSTLMARHVGINGMGALERSQNSIMMGAYQMKQLLDATDVTSWDFIGNLGPDNAPLVQGFVARYAGFDIFISNRLPLVAGVRRCLAWNREAMGIAIWPGLASNRSGDSTSGATTSTFYVTVDRLADYNNSTGIQVMSQFSAVRILDSGVIGIDCVE